MAKSAIARTHSPHTKEALRLLGSLIRVARKERRQTAADLAERAGISRGLLQRIELGEPRCEIGVAFELAHLVGVPLFDAATSAVAGYRIQVEKQLSLMPKSIREHKSDKVFDEF